MTADQLIAVVGQAATWVTVLIVFLTLREMARQRKQSLQPELVIPRIFLHGALDNDYVPSDWSIEPSNEDKNVKLKRRSPNVTIYNLGVGSATNIDLRWDFERTATLKIANQLCQKHSIPILFKMVDLDESRKLSKDRRQIFQIISTKGSIKQSISLENDTHSTRTTNVVPDEGAIRQWIDLENDTHNAHDYLLPVSVSSKGLETCLPCTYTAMVSLLLCFSLNTEHDGIVSLNEPKIPSLRLQLKYKDINGNNYCKKLEATFSLYELTVPLEPSRSFKGRLEFKQSI